MRYRLLFIGLFFYCCSCNQSGGGALDTPTQGSINIAIDESYKLLLETEIYTFQSFYKYAQIKPLYIPEKDAIQALLKDSARLAIVSRELNEKELQVFKEIKLQPRVTLIAIDGVALLVHPENIDSLLTEAQIKNMVTGKDTLWKQINPNSSLGKINMVFDHQNSGNARFLHEKFLDGKPFSKNCYALNSNEEVIKYVSENVNAIGVIGVNWISDIDDKMTQSFLKKVRVVSVANEAEGKFYKPYQAYLKLGKYPFARNVYVISREARTGLGTGFASFIAGEKGQRIILKSGLVPSIAPVRLIKFD